MKIQPPIRGLAEITPKGIQPELTSRSVQNCRPFWPSDLRVMLSRRPGMRKYVGTALGSGKVTRIASTVYDGRNTTFAAITPELVWSKTFRDGLRSRAGVMDAQENVYCFDGDATILKLNSDREVVWILKLPVVDEDHVCRAIALDELGNVYAATSAGGSQSNSRLWRLKQKNLDTPEIVWTVELEFYVEQLIVRGGILHAAANWPDRHLSQFVTYNTILDSGPTEIRRDTVSYPINSFAIQDDGNIVWTSEPQEDRGIDPRAPTFTEQTVDWEPEELEDYEKRVFSRHRAEDLDLEDGASVDSVGDHSGNGRIYFWTADTSESAPVFREKAIGDLPSVRFRGPTFKDALQSNYNSSVAAGSADQQLTPVPMYRTARWAYFGVWRPRLDETATGSDIPRQCMWSLNVTSDGTSPIAGELSLWANREPDTGATQYQGNPRNGFVSFFCKPNSTYPGAASYAGSGVNQPFPGYFGTTATGPYDANTNGAVLVTILWDNGQDATTDDATTSHCLVRINGQPLDRWVGGAFISTQPMFLGRIYDGATGASDSMFFDGEWFEDLWLRDCETAGAMKLVEHPRYPRQVGSGAVVPVAWSGGSETELERIEGYYLHKYRIAHNAPTGTYAAPTGTVGAGSYDPGNYPHPYYRTSGPPPSENSPGPYSLHGPKGIVGKLDGATGALKWVLTSEGGVGYGGVGYGITTHENLIFTMGPKITSAGGVAPFTWIADEYDLRGIVDLGDSFEADMPPTLGEWVLAVGAAPDEFNYHYPRMATDERGNIYVPVDFGSSNTISGLVLGGGNQAGSPSTISQIDTIDGDPATYAILAPPLPTYRIGDGAGNDFKETPVAITEFARSEYAYLLGEPNMTALGSAHKVRLVDSTPGTGSPRTLVSVGVCDGALQVFTSSTVAPPSNADTLAQPELSTTAQYVSAFEAFGKLYFLDGRHYVVFDPKLDKASVWSATTGGKIPPRCKLGVNWRGRAVIARPADGEHQWFMSAQGNLGDWDFFPEVLSATQAVSGVNSRAGLCPDKINALVPYSDDLLIFLCDHSIWALRGDPASALFGGGAQFDLVSDTVGGAFGAPWCKDPNGVLYFFGSRGGVFRMLPGGVPQTLSDDVIPARLRDIDLDENYVEMAWDDEYGGVAVLTFPFGSVSVPTECFFWHRDTGGWWPDRFPIESHPTAVAVVDGDGTDDRRVVYGGADGYVRVMDAESEDDDGTPVDAFAQAGPLIPLSTVQKARILHPQIVTRSDGSYMGWRLRVSEDPSAAGDVALEGESEPGRNPRKMGGGKGTYVWFEFFGYRRWGVESVDATAVPAGRS